MGILNFVKPDKIVLQKANDFEAIFEFRPLEPGYGVTIEGITEDVTEIILNLKQVRFKKKVDYEVNLEKITLSIKNKTEFTAGMIGEASPSFEVMNPELVICMMDSVAKLDIEITVGKG